MADTGAPHSLPYPVASDAPAGHTQMQALAAQTAVRLGAMTYSQILTSENTASGGPVDLTTAGPSVTVTVAANALVLIRAEVTITGSGTQPGNVYLVEDGSSLGIILANTTVSAVVTKTLPGSAVGTATRMGGWLVLAASAASHTYKLQYGVGGAGAGPFSNRKLWVHVLPF